MNLTDDAMQVSLRITAWSGRLYDRQASNHVAVHHDAAASAGRYNKCLLPKAAFAALTATVSACRTAHYENTVPWDDQGSRLLTVANYEHYTELVDGFRERMVRERARFIEDYDVNVDQAGSTWGSSSASRTTPPRTRSRASSRSATASRRSRTPSSSWRSSRPTTWTG